MKFVNLFEKMGKWVGHSFLVAALALGGAACSSDDEPGKDGGNISPDIPTAKFYLGADGYWHAEGREMSQADFEAAVVGNAWRRTEFRDIYQDGTYGDNQSGIAMGLGDVYYCFGLKEMTKYMYLDSQPFRCYATDPYEYGDPVGYLFIGIGTRIKPIGMIDEDHLEIIDCSFWSGANQAIAPKYIVLEKVSPERLEEVKADCGSVDYNAWYEEQIKALEGWDLP
ncbi:MAG: hypothetical protein LIP02_13505 [Bacteroidales bacterium]|nr:hypothetical protein [Bacteroidales bacterium]